MRAFMPPVLLSLCCAPPLSAQGVPTFDAQSFARSQMLIEQRERDNALQQERLAREEELAEIGRAQQESLESLLNAVSLQGRSPDFSDIKTLERDGAQGGATAASELYALEDRTPGADRLFGDARENIEALIIRAARDTHSLTGVSRAGLAPVQWRCLLQALIWQESRFQIGARSPVGAYGLTQIMPGTAGDLGIYPAYYEDPYLQVSGGARYLAQMLALFDGNIIHALAAYNAGPGNVQKHEGVPPFAETQHYVQVVPEQYNRYLASVGGADALGTIDPVLMANASASLSAHGSGLYGDYSMVSIEAAAERLKDIIFIIGKTDSLQESIALNSYARAELARITAIRSRLKAARTEALSDAQLALASAQAAERRFMTWQLKDLQ